MNNIVTDQMPNPTIGGEAKKMIFCNFWASLTKPLHMKLNHDTFIQLRYPACQKYKQETVQYDQRPRRRTSGSFITVDRKLYGNVFELPPTSDR